MDTENFNIFANIIIPILTTLITSAVTIVGLFINNKSIKKKFENEIKKTKSDLMIDKMSIAIEYILDVRNLSLEYPKVKDKERKKAIENESKIKTELFNKIVYAFGSFDAITILESINKELKYNSGSYNILCLYQLLIVQIKYDLTDVVISSISWFEIVLEDYQKQEKNIIENMNNLVDELGLNQEFKIK
ncbi:hypothetical protein [Brachyspira pilosicoli]|uniref:hypothetical protein n=1 Tax=Brachyspira pilosicoli TaxID=52584 RepID=UPI001CA5C567|nr:hypothetical protein [Brachyspira pilosicoli]MBW5381735.1 hypothetical protein [Brachyspira pilosicoli]